MTIFASRGGSFAYRFIISWLDPWRGWRSFTAIRSPLPAVGVARRDPPLIRAVATFDGIERGRVEAASFHQLVRAEAIGEQLVGEEQAEGSPLGIAQRGQTAQSELDRSKVRLALAPIFRGSANAVENAGADSLGVGG